MQKLRINDYNKIKKYLDEANYEGYNSNFVTMMMWDHEYHIEYELHDNYLIMLQKYEDTYYFAMPFCKKEYYQEAIDYMIEYASIHQFDFLIDCVIQEVRDEIKKIYGSKLVAVATPFNDDYIYTREALMTLSGKKMQKRRNHFNAFIKENTDFVYKEIEDEDIDNVLACLKKWDNEHRNEESVQSEFIGIMYLLMHRHELNIRTGCIYINGALEAFIIGSPLRHQTIQIHVEKANREVRGLYVAICKYFLENNYEEYLYVNREEDMGLDSLRQAKQALHPVKMVNKYSIYSNDFVISKASLEDKGEIKTLWQENFEDENDESTEFYFSTCYKEEHTFVLKSMNKVVCAIQIVPYLLQDGPDTKTAYFILGVSTKKQYQRNGCMKILMEHILSMEPYKDHTILLQAYNPNIYYPFGFKEMYYQQQVIIENVAYPIDEKIHEQQLDVKDLLSLYQKYTQNFTGQRIRDEKYYQEYLLPRCEAFDDHIIGIYNDTICVGYCIYHQNEDSIAIQEIIYQGQNGFDDCIRYFTTFDKQIIVTCDTVVEVVGQKEILSNMLSNDISTSTIDTLFINEIL